MASSSDSSYVSSLETTNYARICRIVVDVFRDILFQVLTHEIPSADLPMKVQTNINKLGNLNLKIKTWLCSISSSSSEIPSAEKFDVSSLYTIIRNLCSQVPAPSTKWGQIPPSGGITLGDDIERVREFRNTLYGHATQAKIETPDFNTLCIDIKNVVNRFDAHFHSVGNPMKCDFGFEIDSILACSMDRILEDDYIDKMKQIAVLSDDLGDVKKKVDIVYDVVIDVQKDLKEHIEDTKKNRMGIQENETDKTEGMNDRLVDDKQDSEKEKAMKANIKLEMPPCEEFKICIIKGYVDLKLDLETDTVISIAKDLFKKKKDKDVLEDIAKAEIRRLHADLLLKRVLQLEEKDLKIFFDLLKRKCPETAQNLVEIKITDKDRIDFTQVQESIKVVPHRMQSGLKFEQQDEEFFQRQLQNRPEKVDKIADMLLSKFHISIFEHSQLIQINDPMEKIKALLDKIESCHFDSDSKLQNLLGSKLYKKWQHSKADGSRKGLENKSIWHRLQEKLQSSKDYLIRHFRGLRILFIRAIRGSLVLKFVTLDNFDVKLLKPEAVKTKVLEMIKTLCPEYQDLFKEPIHLAIFYKPMREKDRAEVHFFLETSEEKEACSCARLGSHDIHYMVEELNAASLSNWMINKYQLNEDTKAKLVDLISLKNMSRRKKMKNLLSIVQSFGNGYEMLGKYCEEHDTFVYDKVFKRRRQRMVVEKPDGSQQAEFSQEKEEGLQRLCCTWIDFTEDPKGKENVVHSLEEVKDMVEGVSACLIDVKHARQLGKENAGDSRVRCQNTKDKMIYERKKQDRALEDLQTNEPVPMTVTRKRPTSSYKNLLPSFKKPYFGPRVCSSSKQFKIQWSPADIALLAVMLALAMLGQQDLALDWLTLLIVALIIIFAVVIWWLLRNRH